jgi:hypothetical protein
MDGQIKRRIDPLPPAPKGDDMEGITQFLNGLPVLVNQLTQAWADMKAEAEQKKDIEP